MNGKIKESRKADTDKRKMKKKFFKNFALSTNC